MRISNYLAELTPELRLLKINPEEHKPAKRRCIISVKDINEVLRTFFSVYFRHKKKKFHEQKKLFITVKLLGTSVCFSLFKEGQRGDLIMIYKRLQHITTDSMGK